MFRYINANFGRSCLSDVNEINTLIKSGKLKYYDAHPYVNVITRAELDSDDTIIIKGMYNNKETTITMFDNIWDFYDHFDDEYKVLDLA